MFGRRLPGTAPPGHPLADPSPGLPCKNSRIYGMTLRSAAWPGLQDGHFACSLLPCSCQTVLAFEPDAGELLRPGTPQASLKLLV